MTHSTAKTFIITAAVTAATLAGIGGYAYIESQRPAVLELFVFNTPGYPITHSALWKLYPFIISTMNQGEKNIKDNKKAK